MIEALRTIAVRLALCAGAAWLLARAGVGVGVVAIGALVGIVLARPLIDLVIAIYQLLRQAQWRDVQGRHYAFRGRPVQVVADLDHQRWVRLADVRHVLGFTATDGALQITYPNGFRSVGPKREAHLSAEALVAHLGTERSAQAANFSRWVEREIAFPARRARERRGIRLDTQP